MFSSVYTVLAVVFVNLGEQSECRFIGSENDLISMERLDNDRVVVNLCNEVKFLCAIRPEGGVPSYTRHVFSFEDGAVETNYGELEETYDTLNTIRRDQFFARRAPNQPPQDYIQCKLFGDCEVTARRSEASLCHVSDDSEFCFSGGVSAFIATKLRQIVEEKNSQSNTLMQLLSDTQVHRQHFIELLEQPVHLQLDCAAEVESAVHCSNTHQCEIIQLAGIPPCSDEDPSILCIVDDFTAVNLQSVRDWVDESVCFSTACGNMFRLVESLRVLHLEAVDCRKTEETKCNPDEKL
jgi:hypothetical protein